MLQILQGFSSSLFYWDKIEQSYRVKSGIFLTHLSRSSLHAILGQFVYSATCLRLVELLVDKVETYIESPMPTLSAFTCCVAAWIKVCGLWLVFVYSLASLFPLFSLSEYWYRTYNNFRNLTLLLNIFTFVRGYVI